jgi:tetratricopeptide (TPR) repeat protein
MPPMDRAAALDLLRPIVAAVDFAHRRRVAHRDLKPGNVFLVDSPAGPVPKVLDFGIAKLLVGDGDGDGQATVGMWACSPQYAAPEQLSYGRTGPHTDVHALGLLLGELLTGQPPYAEIDGFEVAISERRPTPARKGIDVGSWEAIIARAVALRPADRFPTARAFLDALEEDTRRHGNDETPGPGPRVYFALPGRSDNEAAQFAYQQGRFLFEHGRLAEAIGRFEECTRLDERFAAGFAALAACHTYGAFAGHHAGEIQPLAVNAARRALELDGELADAQMAYGSVRWLHSWDWPAAWRHLRRALELDPRSANAHLMYGQLCLASGRLAEAVSETARAMELEPASRFVHLSVMRTHHYTRRFEEQLQLINAVVDAWGLDPSGVVALRRSAARAYLELGKIEAALREAQAAFDAASWASLEVMACVLACAGRSEDASLLVQRLEKMALDSPVPALALARVYCTLQRLPETFTALEAAYQQRDVGLPFLGVDPRFDVLRREARFATLVKQVGIPILPSEQITVRADRLDHRADQTPTPPSGPRPALPVATDPAGRRS